MKGAILTMSYPIYDDNGNIIGTSENGKITSAVLNAQGITEEGKSKGAGNSNKNKDGSVKSNDKATNPNSSDGVIDQWIKKIYDWTDTFFNVYELEDKDNKYTKHYNVKSITGIEGMPYQFLPSVDRRVSIKNPDNARKKGNSSKLSLIGRKYSEKIITQIPLLFMAPCNPRFMGEGFTSGDKTNMLSAMIDNAIDLTGFGDLIEGSGRFYSASFAFDQYSNYLNAMLTMVATYLGIEKEKIYIHDKEGNGHWEEIGKVNWCYEYHTPYGEAVNAANNEIFYIDSINTINENFANTTTQSQFAGLINGFSDTAKEIDYFFGSSGSNAISSMKQSVSSAVGSMASSLSSVLSMDTAGGIVNSLGKGGIQSILDGGKIVFPEMWSDSSFDRSYNIDIKLRSPDNDTLSIFLNVLKPYCKILCFTLPHMTNDNANTYRTPFITRAYCKGLFNVDLGIISALSVSKGAMCCWNDDGLPTQIDLSIDLKDLYSQLSMTGYEDDKDAGGLIRSGVRAAANSFKQTYNIVSNTSYMDFLANMAGLNVNEMEFGRKFKMYKDLFSNEVSNLWENKFGVRWSNLLQNTMSRVYATF